MMASIGMGGGDVVAAALGWLLTYAVHSTILLGGAALVTLRWIRTDAWRETVWRAALVGALLTATLQSGLGLQPFAGEWRIAIGGTGGARTAELANRLPAGEPAIDRLALEEGLAGAAQRVAAKEWQARGGGIPRSAATEWQTRARSTTRPSSTRHRAAEPEGAFVPPLESAAVPDPASSVGRSNRNDLRNPAGRMSLPGVRSSTGPKGAVSPPSVASKTSSARPSESVSAMPAGLADGMAEPPPVWPQVLLMIWVIGAAFLLIRLVYRQFRLHRLLRDRHPVTEGDVLSVLAALRRNAGVWRPVELTASLACPGPLALGTSEICVPERFLRDLDPEQQRSALAHELAHLARRDPAWHLLTGVLEAAFFFQPLNRLARLRLREWAENLSDDWAVRQTGSALGLARCLAEVASWVGHGRERVPSGTMAMAEGGSPLLLRVERLLGGRTDHISGGRLLRSAAGAGMILLVLGIAPVVSAGAGVARLEQSDATEAGAREGSATTGETGKSAALPGTTAMEEMRSGATAAEAGQYGATGTAAGTRRAIGGSSASGGFQHLQQLRDGAFAGPARAGTMNDPAIRGNAGVPRVPASQAGTQEQVIRHPSPDEPLDARWQWAAAEAARRSASSYWVAYAFERMLPADYVHVDDSGDWSTDEIDDMPLGALVYGPSYRRPAAAGLAAGPSNELPQKASGLVAQPVLVLLHMVRLRAGEPRVARVSIRTASAGMDRGGVPLYWLGPASDAESFAWLRSELEVVQDARLQGTLIEAMAMHEDAARVVPFLEAIVTSDRPTEVREEAIEGLGWHPVDRSVALLRTTALEDRSGSIREEAAETLGELGTPAAAAALNELLRVSRSDGVRAEAIEALALAQTPEVLEALTRVALEDPDRDIQEEAIEVIAQFPARSAVPVLDRIARTHLRRDMRSEAVEALGEVDPEAAANALEQLLQSDVAWEVRDEALHVLAERHSPRSLAAIFQVAMADPDPDLQEEAVEEIAAFGPAAALPRLEQIIWEHPRADVREEAVEALAELPADIALPSLDEIVAGHEDGRVVHEAIQAIAQFPPAVSVPRLTRIMREHPSEAARREALDQLGDMREWE